MDINVLMKNLEQVVRTQERNGAVEFLENLQKQSSGINLYGAILLLKEHYGKSN